MHDIDLLIFDLDGTLVDSKLDIANGVNHTLRQLGLPTISNEEIYRFVGHGVRDLITDAVGNHPEKQDEALRLFMDYYQGHLADQTRLFPGIIEVLNHFSNKKLGILTNKPQSLTGPLLQQLGIFDKFQIVIGGEASFPRKPDPTSTRHILKTLKVAPQRAIIIGDSAVDIETGKNAAILTCGVTYGFRPRSELEASGCDLLIDQPAKLMEKISK